MLYFLEIIAALSSLFNRILLNQKTSSSEAWIWQMISCFFSTLLAIHAKLLIISTLEIWGFALSLLLYVLRKNNYSEARQKNIQIVSAIITFAICLTILLLQLSNENFALIEFTVMSLFLFGLVLHLNRSKYGHLMFAIGNCFAAYIFFRLHFVIYFTQQVLSFVFVLFTFFGYKIDFFKFKISQQE